MLLLYVMLIIVLIINVILLFTVKKNQLKQNKKIHAVINHQ